MLKKSRLLLNHRKIMYDMPFSQSVIILLYYFFSAFRLTHLSFFFWFVDVNWKIKRKYCTTYPNNKTPFQKFIQHMPQSCFFSSLSFGNCKILSFLFSTSSFLLHHSHVIDVPISTLSNLGKNWHTKFIQTWNTTRTLIYYLL